MAALYNTEMTGVYSGGLVYEYIEEGGSGFGLVTIDSTTGVTETAAFTALVNAFANTTDPSGDGGFKSSGVVSTCPTPDSTWDVTEFTGTALPAIPAKASNYGSTGAGKGPGLTGSGSQNAGDGSSGTASAGSGAVTATGTSSSGSTASASSSKGAASSLIVGEMSMAPFVCSAIVIISTLFGAALL